MSFRYEERNACYLLLQDCLGVGKQDPHRLGVEKQDADHADRADHAESAP